MFDPIQNNGHSLKTKHTSLTKLVEFYELK